MLTIFLINSTCKMLLSKKVSIYKFEANGNQIMIFVNMNPHILCITKINLPIKHLEAWKKNPIGMDFEMFTAWKVSVFGVILVPIFPHLDWRRRDTPYLVGMRENTDQNNSKYEHFLCSVCQVNIFIFLGWQYNKERCFCGKEIFI